MIENFKDSFDDIGATAEHAERLLGASTEHPLGSSNTHPVYNIRSEPEWDKLGNREKLPLVRRSGYVVYTLYIAELAWSNAIPRSICTNSPVLESRRRFEI